MQVTTQTPVAAAAAASNVSAIGSEKIEYLTNDRGPEIEETVAGWGNMLSLARHGRVARPKEGVKRPELPPPGVMTTHVMPAVEKTGHYVVEMPAALVLRGIDKTMDAANAAVDYVKGVPLPDIKIGSLFDKKKKKGEEVQTKAADKTDGAAAAQPVLEVVPVVDRASAAVATEANRTAGTQAVGDMIAAGESKAPVSVQVITPTAPVVLEQPGVAADALKPLASDLPPVTLDNGQQLERKGEIVVLEATAAPTRENAPADGGGFSGTPAEESHPTMAQTLNVKYSDFFDQKFDSIKQAVAFKPEWLGDDQMLDAMYNDDEFRSQMKVGHQVRCVDAAGRKVIATGTSVGPVIVYQSNPNSGKLLMIAPPVFRRTHFLRSTGTTLDPSEYEIVLGSIDGKSTCNIGKAFAQLAQAVNHNG